MVIKITLIVIAVTLSAIAGFFGLIVLLVLNTSKMNAKPKIERINLSPMPGVDENFYLEYNNVLTSEGFEFSGDYSVVTAPDQETKMRVFLNFNEGIEASLYQLRVKDTQKIVISLETEFEDGFKIATTTNREPSVFKLKNKKVFALPGKDLKELIAFHRERVKEESETRISSQKKISSSVIESIADSYIKELNEQLEYGILKYDSATDTYRFTLYGALRGTSKMILYSFTKDRNKNTFDKQRRVKNRKKEFIESLNKTGFIIMAFGAMYLILGKAKNSRVLYFRISSVLLGALIAIVTGCILRTKKFEDS